MRFFVLFAAMVAHVLAHNNPLCKTQGIHYKPAKSDPKFKTTPFIWVEYCGDISWKAADAWCKKEFNTHLASIHCSNAQSWATKLCHVRASFFSLCLFVPCTYPRVRALDPQHEESEEKDHNNHCWIGVHDAGGGNWRWSDGSAMDYTKWKGGALKPNDPNHLKVCV